MKYVPFITEFSPPLLLPALITLLLSGCTVGPDYKQPHSVSPTNWSEWRSGDPSLHMPVSTDKLSSADWWKSYNDPVLNRLVTRALAASPDLQTAALHFSSAQAQAGVTKSQLAPQINGSGQMTREQSSENGASTRVIRLLTPEPDEYVGLLASPYTSYQAGVNASWEIDFWGHVRRAVEAAKADTEAQRAMLELAKLSIVSDVVTQYYTLRDIQQQINLMQDDQRAIEERLHLISAMTRGGEMDYTSQARQQADLSATQARVTGLRQQEAAAMNQILLLLGEHPGALQAELKPQPTGLNPGTLPELATGLPSDIARNRPDVQAAEAKLHAATARISVAKAELYPSVTLNGRLGLDTYSSSEFSDWASRTWSVGPSLNLPLFDYGRRKSTVVLRELDQQQAAVDFHKTVLKAWQEIDDALSRYSAAQQTLQQRTQQAASAAQAYALIDARYRGGMTDFINVLDSQRSNIQARVSLANAQSEVMKAFAAVNRATGNVPE